jgi:hypothetical protein
MTAFALLADLIANHVDAEVLKAFKASDDVHDHFYSLLERGKTGIATTEEIAEIEQFMQVEHIIQLAKSRVKQHAGQ